ncbi:MAG TPA: lysophospholipid acyltransferase family protein [Candidatus Methylacidiphilales bacterium]|nr:lysophospholipid acyltransferase family protein [Candidatus Methylacidiphilales bacterium]
MSPHSAGLYRAAMFDAGAWLARRLPLGLIRALAGWAGSLYALTHPKRVAIVESNLRLLDASLDRKSARRVYREFGKTLADYFYIGTRPPEQAMKIVTQSDGLEHFRAARELGKGALVVTAHFGLFELGGLMLAQMGIPCAVLTYPEPSRALTEWRAAFRRRWNADTIEIGADNFAFLEIAGRLRRGEFVATLIDRPHPTDNTPVSLPNGTAYFSAGILLLAAHGGVPVIPATMSRRADGAYHSRISPPIFIEERGSRAETLRFYSRRIADTLLPALCAHPGQWYQFVPLVPQAR